MTKFYLVSVWKDGHACEEFSSFYEAQTGVQQLLKDHPDVIWKLIEGVEVSKCVIKL